MAIAKKALVWSLFAVGGTMTALLFPALMVIFLLISVGYVPDGLSFGNATAFSQSWPGKMFLFGVLFLSIWHAAHRLRVIFHDIGLRADTFMASVLYVLAALGTLLTAYFLWTIR